MSNVNGYVLCLAAAHQQTFADQDIDCLLYFCIILFKGGPGRTFAHGQRHSVLLLDGHQSQKNLFCRILACLIETIKNLLDMLL